MVMFGMRLTVSGIRYPVPVLAPARAESVAPWSQTHEHAPTTDRAVQGCGRDRSSQKTQAPHRGQASRRGSGDDAEHPAIHDRHGGAGDKIHEVSLRILSEAGIAFYDEVALATLREAGAKVDDDQVVRFDPEMVEAALDLAPPEFDHKSRNSEKTVTYGGNNIVLAPVAGPPYVMDADGGRREGLYADLVNFVKMANATPYLHNQGTEICVTADIPFHERALDINYAHIRWGDKPMMGHYPIGLTARDSVEMARILHGADRVASEHFLMAVINVSSPRRLDDRMLGTIRAYAGANQAVCLTPFILAGAMGPAAILGTVAQANAEVLGALVYTQLVNPGSALHLRPVPSDARSAKRVARVWQRRVAAGAVIVWPNGEALRHAVQGRRDVCVFEGHRHAGRVRGRLGDAALDAHEAELRPSRRGLAREWPDDWVREVRPRPRAMRSAPDARTGRVMGRGGMGARFPDQ